MRRTCKELKRIARENLNGHYGTPMGAAVVAGMITAAIELPFSMLQTPYATTLQTVSFYIAELLIGLISVVLSVGQLKIHLCMARKQEYAFSQLFYGFKNKPDRYLIAGFLQMLLYAATALPMIAGIALAVRKTQFLTVLAAVILSTASILLIIYVQLMFCLLYYILIDRSEMRVLDAFGASRRHMKGNMGRLLYMQFSFIGMQLLVILSFGIGALWINPYQNQTLTNFYLDVIGELPDTASAQQESGQENPPSFHPYV